jgi:hypothetical protein
LIKLFGIHVARYEKNGIVEIHPSIVSQLRNEVIYYILINNLIYMWIEYLQAHTRYANCLKYFLKEMWFKNVIGKCKESSVV